MRFALVLPTWSVVVTVGERNGYLICMKCLVIASFEHRDFYIGAQPGDVFETGFVRSGATNDSSSMSTVFVASSGLRRGRECAVVMLCRCCV